jgi:hypothetical protein
VESSTMAEDKIRLNSIGRRQSASRGSYCRFGAARLRADGGTRIVAQFAIVCATCASSPRYIWSAFWITMVSTRLGPAGSRWSVDFSSSMMVVTPRPASS